jgi:hypothetical protein
MPNRWIFEDNKPRLMNVDDFKYWRIYIIKVVKDKNTGRTKNYIHHRSIDNWTYNDVIDIVKRWDDTVPREKNVMYVAYPRKYNGKKNRKGCDD